MKEYMKDVSVEDAVKAGRTDTICWDCKKSCNGGCSWSNPEQMKPVEGWTAIKTGFSYTVYECPEFIRETYGCGRYRTAEDYILALEIGLTERKQQLVRMKKTPNRLREKIVTLKKQLNRELWQAEVHMSE